MFVSQIYLTVFCFVVFTAASVRPPPAAAAPTQPESRERFSLYAAAGLAAAAAMLVLVCGLVHLSNAAPEDAQSEDSDSEKHDTESAVFVLSLCKTTQRIVTWRCPDIHDT